MPNIRDEHLYRQLYRIRRVEEEIIRLYPSDSIKSPVHLSIGQNPLPSAYARHLRSSMSFLVLIAGMRFTLQKGGDLKSMMAELYGKSGGNARGKAGSMHLVDTAVGMMGTSAIVATTIPQAVGYALAVQMRGEKTAVVVFFGDGATDEGVYSESLNFAALKKLPILFVCENNGYAIYSSVESRMPDANFCERAESYRIPAVRIKSGITHEIGTAAASAITKIRNSEGPQFMECLTARWRDHVGPDEDRIWKYRSDAELDDWIKRDDLAAIGESLEPADRSDIEAAVESEIAEAIAFAEASPFPGDEELLDHVFR